MCVENAEKHMCRRWDRARTRRRPFVSWCSAAIYFTDSYAGTREALAEQLRLGQELRRKVERPASGSDGSTDASDASDASGDEHGAGGGAGAAPAKDGGGRAQPARVRAAALDLLHGGSFTLPTRVPDVKFDLVEVGRSIV